MLCFVLLLACNSEAQKFKIVDDQPRRTELLFLGHASEHHNSRAYFPILASVLAPEGINITYTEDVNDLNTDNLDLYDGLIVYANHESIKAAQEKSLLNFVSEGNAFIPIHSASYCFLNSPQYIKLVGAQFKEHGTGTFKTTIVNHEHPAVQGVEAFLTWDETYVHTKIADDIEVLMERVDGNHHEPFAWIRQHGMGKVFYTAYGHDERTWNNPGFLQLLKQGILWALDDTVKKNLVAFAKDIPTLEYEERSGIPNYEERDPTPKYQLPLSPEASEKLIQVPPGFKISLFASEPDIINPIAMNWDEKGRLWVIETVDYPNTVRNEQGIGDDRVKILEDTDGDGKADKVTVFAEELNIPTSFTFYNGGIVVSQAPHFLFLKDTNGDDIADVREIIIDGWGTSDTHAGPSNLQNGIDNNIYGVVGYSGFEGRIYNNAFDFSQNVYRFNPKKKYFEILTNTTNNTWGLGITEDNSIFASTANNEHSVFLGIPNAAIEGVVGISDNGSLKIDGHYDMQPITRNYRQVDVFGGFTAAAGHHFYTARNYPSRYWNKIAFICEPTGGLVHTAKIIKNGAGYIEKDGGNLFASSDEWVSPVEAKVGPDGNVWVADWYNFIVQHNPTPSESFGGFKGERGDGNAYENPLRDKSNGRIWRVIPKTYEADKTVVLDIENPKDLIQALSHENMFWRMTAQRLLVESRNTDVLSSLYKLVTNSKVDDLGMNPGALHALWTIEGLIDVEYNMEAQKVLEGALNHPAAAIRKAAIQILPKNSTTDDYLSKSKILYDTDASVRLAALLYYTERPSSESLGKLFYELSKEMAVVDDVWLSKAVYAAANRHSAGFIKQYAAENPKAIKEITPDQKRETSDYDDTAWQDMEIPQFIEDAGLQMDGVIWFRRVFNLNTTASTEISLGPIDDSDITYINGTEIGHTENAYAENRYYKVPANVLKKGTNTIAIRVEDTGGGGGMYGKSEQMFIKSGGRKIALAGKWKYEVETDFAETKSNPFDGTSIGALFAEHYNKVVINSESFVTASGEGVVITMKTIQNEMKYDLTEFEVKAGETVTIVFENNDFMQHNLLILAEGSIEKVGEAADKLAQDPNAANRNYIPRMPEVLYATAIVNPKEKETLQFTAPDKPGNYPYVCTFPGHWRIMQGVMKVVK
jgi:putative membrane-bound dehydrogenase-like protein